MCAGHRRGEKPWSRANGPFADRTANACPRDKLLIGLVNFVLKCPIAVPMPTLPHRKNMRLSKNMIIFSILPKRYQIIDAMQYDQYRLEWDLRNQIRRGFDEHLSQLRLRCRRGSRRRRNCRLAWSPALARRQGSWSLVTGSATSEARIERLCHSLFYVACTTLCVWPSACRSPALNSGTRSQSAAQSASATLGKAAVLRSLGTRTSKKGPDFLE